MKNIYIIRKQGRGLAATNITVDTWIVSTVADNIWNTSKKLMI